MRKKMYPEAPRKPKRSTAKSPMYNSAKKKKKAKEKRDKPLRSKLQKRQEKLALIEQETADLGSTNDIANWSPEQLDALREGIERGSPSDKFYWEKIARAVSAVCGDKKTAQQCFDKFHKTDVATGAPKISISGKGKPRSARPKVLKSQDDVFLASPVVEVEMSFSDDEPKWLSQGSLLIRTPSPEGNILQEGSPQLLKAVDRQEIESYIGLLGKRKSKEKKTGQQKRKKTTRRKKKKTNGNEHM